MKPLVHILPAAPGWRLVHRDGRHLLLGYSVIAWRVETREEAGDSETLFNTLHAITSDGSTYDPPWGFQRPDGSVEECTDEFVWETFEEAQRFIAGLPRNNPQAA